MQNPETISRNNFPKQFPDAILRKKERGKDSNRCLLSAFYVVQYPYNKKI